MKYPYFAHSFRPDTRFGNNIRRIIWYRNVMEEKPIRCMDLVELCPPYDNGATASIALKLMAKVISMSHTC